MFAFLVVCAGVLVKDKEFGRENRYVPYINGQFIVPVILLVILGILYYFNNDIFTDFFTITPAEGESMWQAFSHKIPLIVFILLAGELIWLSLIKKLSLIPVLGVLSCAYLMTELGWTNWFRFGLWLLVGLIIYFVYGRWNSNLNKQES